MKTIDGKQKITKSDKRYTEIPSQTNRRYIIEDSLISFWDNEYDEAWNDC